MGPTKQTLCNKLSQHSTETPFSTLYDLYFSFLHNYGIVLLLVMSHSSAGKG